MTVEQVVAAIGLRPLNTSLDRIDPNKDYTSDNIKWATRKEQARNRNSNHLVEYDGNTLSIAEWSERTGFPETTISYRLKSGWSSERALTSPASKKSPKEYRRQAVKLKSFQEKRNSLVRLHRDMGIAWHEYVAEYGVSPLATDNGWQLSTYEFFNNGSADPEYRHLQDELGFPPLPSTKAEVDEFWAEIELKLKHEEDNARWLEESINRERMLADQGDEFAKGIESRHEAQIAEQKQTQEEISPYTLSNDCDAGIAFIKRYRIGSKYENDGITTEALRSRMALEILRDYSNENPSPSFFDYVDFLNQVRNISGMYHHPPRSENAAAQDAWEKLGLDLVRAQKV